MPTMLIEADAAEIDAAIRYGRGGVIGCLMTDEGVITVAASARSSTIDICIDERLPDADPEAVMNAMDGAMTDRRVVAGLALDEAGVAGLLHLIRRATEVRARLDARPRSTRHVVSMPAQRAGDPVATPAS